MRRIVPVRGLTRHAPKKILFLKAEDGIGDKLVTGVQTCALPICLGMDRRILACATSMAAGVNVLPWTGPTLRASAALKIPVMEIFRPMIGVQAAGLIFVFAVCAWLGWKEQKRLAANAGSIEVRITTEVS